MAILKHDAAAFWELSRLLEQVATSTLLENGHLTIEEMDRQCGSLNLKISQSQLKKFVAMADANKVTPADFVSFGKHISSVIHSELESKNFVYISEDRAQYLETGWVHDLYLLFVFDQAESELLAAGRCYAYGEPDASVFHSMRALEPSLKSLAHGLGVEYDQTYWQQVITNIEKAIRGLSDPPKQQGKKMSEEDRKTREFCSELATQFVFVKDSWRNHAMHGTRNYSDREARIIMDTVGNILRVAATRLEEVSDEHRSVQSGSSEGSKSLP